MPDQPELTPEGIAFIKSYEGYRAHPYWDVQQYSIGWGTKATELDLMWWDQGRSGWQGIDVQEADERFNEYINTIAVPELNSMLTVETTPEQYAGLVSFIYNVGQPQATAAIRAVNQGNWQSAADEMSQIKNVRRADGTLQESPALVSRRADEVRFLFGSVPERARKHASIHAPAIEPPLSTRDLNRFKESQTGFQPIVGAETEITFPEQNWLDKFKGRIQSGLRTRRTSQDYSRPRDKWQI